MSSVTRAKSGAKKARSPLGDEIATVLNPTSDVRTVIATVIGDERADAWVKAIRSVRMRELVGGTKFQLEPVHEPNTSQERRFCAMLLMILGEISPHGRAWTSRLFRGHNKRLTDDGTMEYVPGKSAGGMSARLGCCPREIDRYLQIAKAAGIVEVWQGPSDAPKRFRGTEYAYAVFRWVGEIPRAVAQKLAKWWGRFTPPPKPRDGAPAPTEAPRVANPEAAARFLAFETARAPEAPTPSAEERKPLPSSVERFLRLVRDS